MLEDLELDLTANDHIKYMFMRKPKDMESSLEQQESM